METEIRLRRDSEPLPELPWTEAEIITVTLSYDLLAVPTSGEVIGHYSAVGSGWGVSFVISDELHWTLRWRAEVVSYTVIGIPTHPILHMWLILRSRGEL